MLEFLNNKEDVIYGMESLRSDISKAVHDKEEDGTITSMDIQALKYLNAGMPIAMRAVEENLFRVPIVVDGSVRVVNVSIVQNGSNAGEISAGIDTKAYGRLDAVIHVSDTQIEGYIQTQEEAGQRVLENGELTIRSVFAKAGMEVKDLRLDGTKPMQYSTDEETTGVETAKLYKISKQLLTAIKLTGVLADN